MSLRKSGGGVPFYMLPHIAGLLPCLPSSSSFHRGRFSGKQGKKGQKLIFIWSVLSNPRILRDNKRQKTNILLKCGRRWWGLWCWLCLPFGVPTGAVVQGAGASGVLRCVPSLCPSFVSALPPLPWCIACKCGSISRFKGVFSAVWGCCAGLYCLRALRGLWGFCVREWLGGFRA